MRIAAVGTALPPNAYDQEQLIAGFESLWAREHHNADRVRRFHEAVGVAGRHLALPMERYAALKGFGDANDAFVEVGQQVGASALLDALALAGLSAGEVDAIWSTTVTGVAAPSLEARLLHRTDLRPDIKRTPMFGLGCVAGAAGISRMHDYLAGHPGEVAALLSVELCSLTLQRQDLSVANLVSSGLFGDGAAAVIAVGDARAEAMGLVDAPAVLATRSRMYPDSERVMGWDVGDGGFKIVLDKSVPDVVRRFLVDDVDTFLGEHGLSRADIASWVCHPGGPAVLSAVEEALELPDDALSLSRASLQEVGNLSSASVLFVLRDTIERRRPARGTFGLMIAMGPGFCSELVLLRW